KAAAKKKNAAEEMKSQAELDSKLALSANDQAAINTQWAADIANGMAFGTDEYVDGVVNIFFGGKGGDPSTINALKRRIREFETVLFPGALIDVIMSFPMSFTEMDGPLLESSLRVAIAQAHFRAASRFISHVDFSELSPSKLDELD